MASLLSYRPPPLSRPMRIVRGLQSDKSKHFVGRLPFPAEACAPGLAHGVPKRLPAPTAPSPREGPRAAEDSAWSARHARAHSVGVAGGGSRSSSWPLIHMDTSSLGVFRGPSAGWAAAEGRSSAPLVPSAAPIWPVRCAHRRPRDRSVWCSWNSVAPDPVCRGEAHESAPALRVDLL